MNEEEALARSRGRPASSPANRSLERGIEILRAFRPGAEVMGNGELAERTGLSRATVSRLTQTLVQCGFLQYDAPLRAYRLAAPVLSLAHAMRTGSVVLQAAAPLMRELAQSQRINVGLAVADGDEMVYLESVRYNRKPSLRTVVAGQRVPMALTSLGRAWLAAAPADQRKAVLAGILGRGRRRAPALAEEIRQAVDSVARIGWCMASWQPEVVAVSTPLRIHRQPIHVLNVSVSTSAAPHEAARELAPLLMALAERILSSETLRPDTS
jgi:DNA-binding IclR family transcriptional regulator